MSLAGLIARMRNVVRQEAQMAMSHQATTRTGKVVNYDPDRYAVRVLIQPEGILTGYIPIKSPWVGNEWGMYAPPSIGDVVDVEFLQGSKDSSGVGGRYYSAKTKPLACPSGEFWIVDKNGSCFKFMTGGNVLISAAGDLRIEANNIKIHGRETFAFDANGQGQKWDGGGVETWQDNDTTRPHHNHAPPETPA